MSVKKVVIRHHVFKFCYLTMSKQFNRYSLLERERSNNHAKLRQRQIDLKDVLSMIDSHHRNGCGKEERIESNFFCKISASSKN